MDGKLFSQDFLLDGIKTTHIWDALLGAAIRLFAIIINTLSKNHRL